MKREELQPFVDKWVHLTRDNGTAYRGQMIAAGKSTAALYCQQLGRNGELALADGKIPAAKVRRWPLEQVARVDLIDPVSGLPLNLTPSGEQPGVGAAGDGLIPQSARGESGRQASTAREVSAPAPSLAVELPVFTPGFKHLRRQARNVSGRMGHDVLRPEHLLIALIDEPVGMAGPVMDRVGLIDARRDDLSLALKSSLIPGKGPTVGIFPESTEYKQLLTSSVQAAASLGHFWCGPEHLLIALFRSGLLGRWLANTKLASVSGEAIVTALKELLKEDDARRKQMELEAAPSAVPVRLRCSFCGRDQDHVKLLFKGLTGVRTAYICNECVGTCHTRVQRETAPEGSEPDHRTIFAEVADEVLRARAKFPRNAHLMVALQEEVGEAAKELLEGRPELLRKELVQVMCLCVRLIEEGDADFAAPAQSAVANG
ncbi:MAG: hypothetical protein GC208_10455 [Alphaproteobacteria bacterium]|nr:hypothetical protein [Alphaproteobacteria bacterium]